MITPPKTMVIEFKARGTEEELMELVRLLMYLNEVAISGKTRTCSVSMNGKGNLRMMDCQKGNLVQDNKVPFDLNVRQSFKLGDPINTAIGDK